MRPKEIGTRKTHAYIIVPRVSNVDMLRKIHQAGLIKHKIYIIGQYLDLWIFLKVCDHVEHH